MPLDGVLAANHRDSYHNSREFSMESSWLAAILRLPQHEKRHPAAMAVLE